MHACIMQHCMMQAGVWKLPPVDRQAELVSIAVGRPRFGLSTPSSGRAALPVLRRESQRATLLRPTTASGQQVTERACRPHRLTNPDSGQACYAPSRPPVVVSGGCDHGPSPG